MDVAALDLTLSTSRAVADGRAFEDALDRIDKKARSAAIGIGQWERALADAARRAKAASADLASVSRIVSGPGPGFAAPGATPIAFATGGLRTGVPTAIPALPNPAGGSAFARAPIALPTVPPVPPAAAKGLTELAAASARIEGATLAATAALASQTTATAAVGAASATASGALATEATAIRSVGSAAGAAAPLLGTMAKTALGVGAALAAVKVFQFVVDLPAQAIAATKSIAALKDEADKLGLSAESFQELSFAAEQNGVAVNEFAQGFTRFTDRLGEAARGSKEAQQSFQQLGVSIADQNGNLISSESAFNAVADAIRDAKDPTEQLTAASNLFGIRSAALVNLLRQGSAGIDSFREAARKAGLITNETAAEADNLDDRFAAASKTIDNQMKVALLGLAPVLLSLSEAFASASVSVGRFFDSIADTKGASLDELERRLERLKAQVPGFERNVETAPPILRPLAQSRLEGARGALFETSQEIRRRNFTAQAEASKPLEAVKVASPVDADSINRSADALANLREQNDLLRASLEGASSSQLSAIQAQQELAAVVAEFGPASAQAAEATTRYGLSLASLAEEDARAASNALLSLQSVMAKTSVELAKTRETSPGKQAALGVQSDQLDAVLGFQATVAEIEGSTDTATVKTLRLAAANETLAASLNQIAATDARTAYDSLEAAIDKVLPPGERLKAQLEEIDAAADRAAAGGLSVLPGQLALVKRDAERAAEGLLTYQQAQSLIDSTLEAARSPAERYAAAMAELHDAIAALGEQGVTVDASTLETLERQTRNAALGIDSLDEQVRTATQTSLRSFSEGFSQSLVDVATGAKTAGDAFEEFGARAVASVLDVIAQIAVMNTAASLINFATGSDKGSELLRVEGLGGLFGLGTGTKAAPEQAAASAAASSALPAFFEALNAGNGVGGGGTTPEATALEAAGASASAQLQSAIESGAAALSDAGSAVGSSLLGALSSGSSLLADAGSSAGSFIEEAGGALVSAGASIADFIIQAAAQLAAAAAGSSGGGSGGGWLSTVLGLVGTAVGGYFGGPAGAAAGGALGSGITATNIDPERVAAEGGSVQGGRLISLPMTLRARPMLAAGGTITGHTSRVVSLSETVRALPSLAAGGGVAGPSATRVVTLTEAARAIPALAGGGLVSQGSASTRVSVLAQGGAAGAAGAAGAPGAAGGSGRLITLRETVRLTSLAEGGAVGPAGARAAAAAGLPGSAGLPGVPGVPGATGAEGSAVVSIEHLAAGGGSGVAGRLISLSLGGAITHPATAQIVSLREAASAVPALATGGGYADLARADAPARAGAGDRETDLATLTETAGGKDRIGNFAYNQLERGTGVAPYKAEIVDPVASSKAVLAIGGLIAPTASFRARPTSLAAGGSPGRAARGASLEALVGEAGPERLLRAEQLPALLEQAGGDPKRAASLALRAAEPLLSPQIRSLAVGDVVIPDRKLEPFFEAMAGRPPTAALATGGAVGERHSLASVTWPRPAAALAAGAGVVPLRGVAERLAATVALAAGGSMSASVMPRPAALASGASIIVPGAAWLERAPTTAHALASGGLVTNEHHTSSESRFVTTLAAGAGMVPLREVASRLTPALASGSGIAPLRDVAASVPAAHPALAPGGGLASLHRLASGGGAADAGAGAAVTMTLPGPATLPMVASGSRPAGSVARLEGALGFGSPPALAQGGYVASAARVGSAPGLISLPATVRALPGLADGGAVAIRAGGALISLADVVRAEPLARLAAGGSAEAHPQPHVAGASQIALVARLAAGGTLEPALGSIHALASGGSLTETLRALPVVPLADGGSAPPRDSLRALTGEAGTERLLRMEQVQTILTQAQGDPSRAVQLAMVTGEKLARPELRDLVPGDVVIPDRKLRPFFASILGDQQKDSRALATLGSPMTAGETATAAIATGGAVSDRHSLASVTWPSASLASGAGIIPLRDVAARLSVYPGQPAALAAGGARVSLHELASGGGIGGNTAPASASSSQPMLAFDSAEAGRAIGLVIADSMRGGAGGGGGGGESIDVHVNITQQGGGEPLQQEGEPTVQRSGRRYDIGVIVGQGSTEDTMRGGPGFRALQHRTGIRPLVQSP